MAIKLGSNPKEFKRSVPIIRLDGGTDAITITYKYRTRREFAALIDERNEAAKEAGITPIGDDLKYEEAYLTMTKTSAEQVLQVASAWDLSDDFNVENLQQLEDEFPGALDTIHSTYQKAVAEVRVKN